MSACCVRVVFVFGGRVKDPVNDLTPTYLTDRILATLRTADSVVNNILQESGNERDLLLRLCVSVCLSACVLQEPHVQFPNFVYMLSVPVARS